ncbi:ParB N-terminal domain-containing protein, partial [Singulisphaera rosea]
MSSTLLNPPAVLPFLASDLASSPFSIAVYGDPDAETDGLLESVRDHGILVPLVVVASESGWEVISGHRRLACARRLGLLEVPCEVKDIRSQAARQLAILEYNRQRTKTFSQTMREADALEDLEAEAS